MLPTPLPLLAVTGSVLRSGGAALRRTFRALRRRNYRIYFIGQTASMSGTWMGAVAQGWLVLTLSGRALDLGVLTALQFGPSLVLSPWGGVIADRSDKRRLLMVTNGVAAVLAFTLGLLTLGGVVQVWMVYVPACLTGCVIALDNPSRQAFVYEMVGRDDLPNAVGLNNVVINASRIVGPALAGVLIASVGTAWCFIGNAGSFLVIIAAPALMRVADLERAAREPRRPRRLRDGLAYVAGTHGLMVPLVMMAVVGTLSYTFSVLLPLPAERVFDRGGGSYGALTTAMGVGALAGAFVVAATRRPTRRLLVPATFAFGACIVAVGLSPGFTAALLLLVPMGAAAVAFVSLTNSLLQLEAEPAMRGRVMALWGAVFFGGTPVGGPLTAAFASWWGTRAAFVIGGAAAALTAAIAAAHLQRRRARL
ncbi:MAG: MFS transporter, partial [Actinobacteria bacterium]|nr:MFS transporter [Actinomycetota bacterium]